MTVRYHLIAPSELDDNLIQIWRKIQQENQVFESPFFCPEFTRIAGLVRDDIWIVVIEREGRPVGFFPYQRSLWGWGKPVGGPLSDYHGVLCAPDCEWQASGLLKAAKLDVWRFDHLVDAPGNLRTGVTGLSTSPQMNIGSGYEAYATGRREAGSDYIVKTERLARKFEKEVGDIEFCFQDLSEDAIQSVTSWKSQQCHRSGVPDVFGVRWTVELLRQILAADSVSFGGVCSVLRVDGRVVAGHIGMRTNNVLHYWFPSYDTDHAKYSTGIILLLRIAARAAELGMQKIDLGKGDTQYKQRLMNDSAKLLEGALTRPSFLEMYSRIRRSIESTGSNGGGKGLLSLPLRAIRRIERAKRFA